ncbi:MAG: hypothetical protein IKK52_06930 [Alphaproteobacteria bacterium]|nr:hypothetical protein [Alphaproteobacteria bacterium]
MKIQIKFLILFVLFALSGCYGSYYEPEPVGIGTGIDELKLSPCACIEVELPHTLPDWFVATI